MTSTVKNWINNTRSKYKRNALNKQEIALLENINGWKWSGSLNGL